MATAQLINESSSRSINNGFAQYTLTQIHQVITDNRDDPPSEAYNATGLPTFGGSAALAGISPPVTVWCNNQSAERPEVDTTGRKWLITSTFTNFTQEFERDENGDPVTDPTDAVKRIDTSYLEYAVPVTDAVLKRFTQKGPDWSDDAEPIDTPNWLSSRTSTTGPVVLSNSEPVYLERTDYRKVITVSKVVRDWNNTWDNYRGAINSDAITLEERDSDGVRWSQQFAPMTLRMRPPRKENIWKDKKLYYRRIFEMEYNENTWIHAELDASTKRRLEVGQFKPEGGFYTAQDLTDLGIETSWGYNEITTLTVNEGKKVAVAVGNPVKLNGYGMEMPVDQVETYDPDSEIYGNWFVNKILPFGPLDL